MYRVRAQRFETVDDRGIIWTNGGFGDRKSAERYAIALANGGRADQCDVETEDYVDTLKGLYRRLDGEIRSTGEIGNEVRGLVKVQNAVQVAIMEAEKLNQALDGGGSC